MNRSALENWPCEGTAVLLLNLGGPDSLANVKPFLYNLFSDKDIIQLPGPQWLQNLFAKLISSRRETEAQENYHKIGGKSPLLEHTEAQAKALESLLKQNNLRLPVLIAMRYWHPFTEEILEKIKTLGLKRLIILPLYPHYSLATTGSSFKELDRVLSQLSTDTQIETRTICAYYDNEHYLSALAETIHQGLSENQWDTEDLTQVKIIFSAHGLPKNYVKNNKDPYPKQITATAKRVMSQFFPNNRWQLCYQSRVGPMEWLTPYTEKLLLEMAEQGEKRLLVVPISFVSDHIETLFELDQLYIPQARQAGVTQIHRAPSFNTSPLFIKTLLQLVQQKLSGQEVCRINLPSISRLFPICSTAEDSQHG